MEKKNKLQVKNEDCVLWVKHAPCLKVCFDEASSAKKCSTRFCRSNNFILLFVVLLPLSRWPSHARCLSRGLHSGIGLFVACGTASTRRVQAKPAAVAQGTPLPLQSFPPHALPQLSLSSLLPGKETLYSLSFSLELGNAFYPQCFLTPKPCGTAPGTEIVWWEARGRWAQGHHGQAWPEHGHETTVHSFAVPYRAPGQPQRSIRVCHIPEDISAPAQMQNEPCRLV